MPSKDFLSDMKKLSTKGDAFGRFFGTLFSGISYQFGGIILCLATSTIMMMINIFFTNKLSANNKEIF